MHSASAFRTIRGGISNIRCLMSYATPSDAKLPGGVATTPDNANDMKRMLIEIGHVEAIYRYPP